MHKPTAFLKSPHATIAFSIGLSWFLIFLYEKVYCKTPTSTKTDIVRLYVRPSLLVGIVVGVICYLQGMTHREIVCKEPFM